MPQNNYTFSLLQRGFSFQTGTGGSSLAVTRFMREQMLKDGIKASFALGGITNAMVELLEEGLVEKLLTSKTLIIHQLFL